MSNSIILFDRSRATTDWQCPRKRYLNYEVGGTGIVPDKEALELFMGSVIHTGLASIATATKNGETPDIDAIAHTANNEMFFYLIGDDSQGDHQFAYEQASLVDGLLRGFYRYQWPVLLAQYPKILAVEQEMSYTYSDVVFMCKPDLVATTPSGEVVYIEYKSTSNKKEEWINSWSTAIQLHATTRAIEASLGEKISHVIVQGLYKGWSTYGKQSSPFCYAYKRSGSPPFSKDEVRYEYAAGFKRSPVWEMDGGIKAWVSNMPDSMLVQQFPCTPLIFIRDEMVDRFFNQRLWREKEIQMAVEMITDMSTDPAAVQNILDVSFPQRFDQCHPAYGRTCPYEMVCHGSVERPLENGFVKRQPHHAIEEASSAKQ